jgi:hypothetical protein
MKWPFNKPTAANAGIFTVLFSLLLAGIMSGCSGQSSPVKFKKQSGDLVQFMDQELRKYGGTPPIPKPRPILRAEWQYSEDKDGFQILIGQDQKGALIQVLTASLGEPQLRESYPHLVYREDRFGVGLMANLESDPIHIICLKKGAL